MYRRLPPLPLTESQMQGFTTSQERSIMRRHLLSVLQSLAVLLSAVVSTDAASYTFTTVDVPFPGAHDTGVAGINNRGVLTGLYLDPTS